MVLPGLKEPGGQGTHAVEGWPSMSAKPGGQGGQAPYQPEGANVPRFQ